MLILSVGAISAADADNMNVTDVSQANDASLAVESTQLEPVNDDVDNDTADTQNTQAKLSADDLMHSNDESQFAGNNLEIDPQFQEILDNLPFDIDPSLIPLLIGDTKPQVKNTEPVQDTFKDLQKLIDDASKGSVLTLAHNYYRTDDFKVLKINKDITIDGNGFAIGFGGLDGRIESQQGNVILKNIEISYSNNQNTDHYALEISGSANYVLDNCKFCYNNGGAIFRYCCGQPDFKFIVNNCKFEGNKAFQGAAISFWGPGTFNIENSTFYGNFAGKLGGAIASNNDMNLKNCRFEKNEANSDFGTAHGGAIFCEGQVNDDGSSFISNYANFYGGAIFTGKDVRTPHTIFKGNEARLDGDNICVSKNYRNPYIPTPLRDLHSARTNYYITKGSM